MDMEAAERDLNKAIDKLPPEFLPTFVRAMLPFIDDLRQVMPAVIDLLQNHVMAGAFAHSMKALDHDAMHATFMRVVGARIALTEDEALKLVKALGSNGR